MMARGRPPKAQTLRVQARQRAGLTQRELAELAGRSVARVRAWERDAGMLDAGLVQALAARSTPDMFDLAG
jgi:transcriptional regulator with XRE-family HTH domain